MKITLDGKNIWVNYHHLYCFYAITNQGSLKKASELLGIGQSALSIQIKQFESQLGFQLFDRNQKKLVLNERGKMVASYAKEIFRLGEEMIQTLLDRPTSRRIHLKIGALDTIPKHLSVALVNRAIDREYSVSVIEGKQNDLLKDLVEHRIDLLITNHLPSIEPGKIYTKRIARLPLWIVGAKKFVKLKSRFPISLDQYPFIVPTADSHVRQEFENFCAKNGIITNVLAETQDIMVQKLLAIQGVGMTIAPQFAVNDYLKNKELNLIGIIPNSYEDLFLIAASRKINNPAAFYLMKHFELK